MPLCVASAVPRMTATGVVPPFSRSEEHTSELQSQSNLECRLLLEKKKNARLIIFVVPALAFLGAGLLPPVYPNWHAFPASGSAPNVSSPHSRRTRADDSADSPSPC